MKTKAVPTQMTESQLANRPAPKTKQKVVTNAAELMWPQDKWGFTRDLKKAIASTASRLAGDKDKKKLLEATLAVGLQFIEDKYEQDAKLKAHRLERALAKAEDAEQVPAETPVEQEPETTDASEDETPAATEPTEPAEPEVPLEDALFGDEEDK